jgi:hypothetical protein
VQQEIAEGVKDLASQGLRYGERIRGFEVRLEKVNCAAVV